MSCSLSCVITPKHTQNNHGTVAAEGNQPQIEEVLDAVTMVSRLRTFSSQHCVCTFRLLYATRQGRAQG